MKLSDAAKAMNGVLQGADADFDWVSTDSRSLKPGELFFAIKGANFDGEAFVERASYAGACAAVVTKHQNDLSFPQIVVKNTIAALGELANFRREKMAGKVVAITGSCGKTSVKGMLKHILELQGRTSATLGNQNNQIGVPLTILSAQEDVDFLIVEAGTSFKGEIEYLTSIIDPDVSVVTNVHSAHMEGFGTLEAIADEKSDIYVAGARASNAIVNACLLQYDSFDRKLPADGVFIFTKDEDGSHVRGSKIYAENIQSDSYGRASFGLCFRHENASISLQVPGLHQIENALAAAACAVSLELTLDVIKHGLEAYFGEKSRMQVLDLGEITMVDDTYNANPGSMHAAIDYLAEHKQSVLILGDMAELGKDAEAEHKNVGSYARQKGIQSLLCVGYFAEDYADGFGAGATVFRSQAELVHYALEHLPKNSTLLVKGSRSAHMEDICNALTSAVSSGTGYSEHNRGAR